MPKRKGGSRRKTRGKFERPIRSRGKLSLRNYLAEYNIGDKVIIKPDPISHEGLIHARFVGRIGTVKKKRGACYEVKIMDREAEKLLIVHPVHIQKNR